jgi:hypothetical protein
MDSFSPIILNALRSHRNQRRLTLEMLSAKVSMSPQQGLQEPNAVPASYGDKA